MRTKLQPGETVALIVRKHWLVLVKPVLFHYGGSSLPARPPCKDTRVRGIAELPASIRSSAFGGLIPLPLSGCKGQHLGGHGAGG